MEAERLTGQRQGHWRHKQGQKVRHGRIREGRQRKRRGGGTAGKLESGAQSRAHQAQGKKSRQH